MRLGVYDMPHTVVVDGQIQTETQYQLDDNGDPVLNAEMEVRSLTGVGAEKATHH